MSEKNYTGVRQVERGGKLRWLIDFRYVDKAGTKQRYKQYALVQARDAAHAEARRLMKNAAETGDPSGATAVVEKPAVLTFKGFVDGQWSSDYLTSYKPSTRQRYQQLLKSGLLDYFGPFALDQVGTVEVRGYVAKLRAQSVDPKGAVDLVRSILRSAHEAKHIISAPNLRGLYKRSDKIPGIYDDHAVEAILAHTGGWLRVAVGLGVYAGLRVGEVIALEVGDVDLSRKRLFIRRAMSGKEVTTTKSGKERTVPVHDELLALLTEAVKDKLPRARVILRSTGTTPSRQNVYTALRRVQKRLGLQPKSFHSLRHTFCTSLLRTGANLDQVRRLAGHSDLNVTQRYLHTSGDELEEAVSRLASRLDRWAPTGTRRPA